MSELAVRTHELPTRDGGCIGVATLNAPVSLNALSLEMIHLLRAKLDAWEHDERIVAVWLEGAGDKAFCAGGDIVALYRAMNGGMDEAKVFATTYFSAEYALDYRIHRYPKPLLVWGDGIVMGGGLGLMAGASYRLVTEASRLAMPEITIGLYPDIGASWFLNRMPSGIGAYLGLTGAQLGARDALDLGLADHLVPRERRDALLDALADADYGTRSRQACHAAVCRAVAAVEERDVAKSEQVWSRRDHIQSLMTCADVGSACANILDDRDEDAWLVANRQRLASGCPLSAHLSWEMLVRHRRGSLADAFRDELSLSVRCCVEGDLAEGVRALLIDKDKTPRWTHTDVSAVPAATVAAMLASYWTDDTHPLRDL